MIIIRATGSASSFRPQTECLPSPVQRHCRLPSHPEKTRRSSSHADDGCEFACVHRYFGVVFDLIDRDLEIFAARDRRSRFVFFLLELCRHILIKVQDVECLLRSKSYRRYVQLELCWISQIRFPPPIAWTVPAGI